METRKEKSSAKREPKRIPNNGLLALIFGPLVLIFGPLVLIFVLLVLIFGKPLGLLVLFGKPLGLLVLLLVFKNHH
jgi:hypothetical protein